VTFISETEEIHPALCKSGGILTRNVDIDGMSNISQRRRFLGMWTEYGIETAVREFYEEQDVACIKMRMLAIWEAQKSMTYGANDRNDSLIFLALRPSTRNGGVPTDRGADPATILPCL
jgi:hypothetical protein